MPTNDERAQRGRVLLNLYSKKYGDPYDDMANLTDILADLMHLAHRYPEFGLNFSNRLEMANLHFQEELLEESSTDRD